jgi:hypothetical protein
MFPVYIDMYRFLLFIIIISLLQSAVLHAYEGAFFALVPGEEERLPDGRARIKVSFRSFGGSISEIRVFYLNKNELKDGLWREADLIPGEQAFWLLSPRTQEYLVLAEALTDGKVSRAELSLRLFGRSDLKEPYGKTLDPGFSPYLSISSEGFWPRTGETLRIKIEEESNTREAPKTLYAFWKDEKNLLKFDPDQGSYLFVPEMDPELNAGGFSAQKPLYLVSFSPTEEPRALTVMVFRNSEAGLSLPWGLALFLLGGSGSFVFFLGKRQRRAL